MYNALNDSDYTNADDLVINTIEDVIYAGMKNDVSFIFDNRLNLYEQQSTFNPNMPVRCFLYLAKLYEKYINTADISVYGHKTIALPTPKIVVFYNGKEQRPDAEMLSLTDAMEFPEESDVNLSLKVINLNNIENQHTLKGCQAICEYSILTQKVNSNLAFGLSLKDAVRRAVDSCIEENILKDVLLPNKSEVVDMILTEYDEAKTLEALYREGKSEGVEEGFAEGIEKGYKQGIRQGIEQGKIEGAIEFIVKILPYTDEKTLLAVGFTKEQISKAKEL